LKIKSSVAESRDDETLAEEFQRQFGGTLERDSDGAFCVINYINPAKHGAPVYSTRFLGGAQMALRSAKSGIPSAANDNAPPQCLRLADWSARRFVGEPPPIEYLVSGVIEAGKPGMVAAMGEVGKSFTLLELCRRVAYGSSALGPPIFGGQVVQEGTAVFLTGEDDANAIHRRIASIDERQARFAAKGDKLIAVPMPSALSTIRPFWQVRKGDLIETDAWRQLCEQLSAIGDLKVAVIDPLQLFAALPINEDPAAGQFVCASIATLAAHTGANIFFAHHMKKSGREILTLADARDAIRGTTALVDGVRLAYGLWYPDADKARKQCKALGIPYQPNAIVHGGVVKANGASRRLLSTYARNEHGLLIDRTSGLGAAAPDQGDLLAALVIVIEAAAQDGHPFTKTGESGLFKRKATLPEELKTLSRGALEGLAEQSLERGLIVPAIAKGQSTVKWLDVPTGPFATGIGEFIPGAAA
jgi:AAA domain